VSLDQIECVVIPVPCADGVLTESPMHGYDR
jgi:hypothetical protein